MRGTFSFPETSCALNYWWDYNQKPRVTWEKVMRPKILDTSLVSTRQKKLFAWIVLYNVLHIIPTGICCYLQQWQPNEANHLSCWIHKVPAHWTVMTSTIYSKDRIIRSTASPRVMPNDARQFSNVLNQQYGKSNKRNYKAVKLYFGNKDLDLCCLLCPASTDINYSECWPSKQVGHIILRCIFWLLPGAKV